MIGFRGSKDFMKESLNHSLASIVIVEFVMSIITEEGLGIIP